MSIFIDDSSSDDGRAEVYEAQTFDSEEKDYVFAMTGRGFQKHGNRGDKNTSRTKIVDNKVPPGFDGEMLFSVWVEKVDRWRELTELDKSKHGPAMYAALSGRAQIFTTDIDFTKLRLITGPDYLIEFLRPHFVREGMHLFLFRQRLLEKCVRKGLDFLRWFAILNKRLKMCKQAWGETAHKYEPAMFEVWQAGSHETCTALELSGTPADQEKAKKLKEDAKLNRPLPGLEYTDVYNQVKAFIDEKINNVQIAWLTMDEHALEV